MADDRHSSSQPNVPADRAGLDFSPRFSVLVVLTGVAAGLGGAALMKLLRAVQHGAWSYDSGDFLHGVERTSSAHRVLVLLGAGVLAGAGAMLVRRVMGGGGVGVSEAVWLRKGRVPLWQTLARAVVSIVQVGLGASLGREAAPQEVGAAAASRMSEWGRLTRSQRRLLVACGASAGMAAVYNVPFGGALFAAEVLLGTLALPYILPALATSLIATGVAWIALPTTPTYTIPTYAVSASEVAWAVIVGPLAGLAAVIYVRTIATASAHKPKGWRLALAPIVVFTALGFVSIAYPQLLGNGKDVVQQAFLAQVGVPLLAALLVLKPLATAGCLGSGGQGGLFTPTLTYGVLFGGLLGRGWALIWPGAPLGSYAIIGGGAVLAATMQGPVSAIVLMLELTHHVDTLMVPLALAVTEATLVARLLDARSIYSARLPQ